MSPEIVPLGFLARTRCRISAITPAKSSLLGSIPAPAGFPAPACRDGGVNSTPRREFTGDRGLHRTASLHHVAQDPIDDVLLKDAEIAISQCVHLQRLQF